MRLLDVGVFFGKSILLFFFVALVVPLRFLVNRVLLPISVRLYKFYMPLKQWFQAFFAPAKNSWLYLFTTRYILHITIIILTLLVTTNNLLAEEVQVEDFGKGTIIASILGGGPSEEIVETAQSFSVPKSYRNEKAVLAAHVSLSNEAFVTNLNRDEAVLESNGAALVKTDLIDTSYAGRPREAVVEYTVLGGDTISTIAAQYGISTSTILWANNLSATDYIKPGQKLKVPPVSGVLHTVKSGDTVAKLAAKYKTDEEKILEFNRLPDASAIEVGQQIMIPGGRIDPPKPKPAVRLAGARPATAPSAIVSGTKLQWPTSSHRINQYVRRGHVAIDIDGNRSPIYAAEAGIVVKANWGRGYGIHIVIDHGGGLKTLYAHNSVNHVRVGDRVSRGQVIATTGCTGWCTGDHVHFEVIVNGRKVNPLSYF